MIANNKSANRDAEASFIGDRDKALTVSSSLLFVSLSSPLTVSVVWRDLGACRVFLRPAAQGRGPRHVAPPRTADSVEALIER